MNLESFFNTIVGSREGEFRPSSTYAMTEEELTKRFEEYDEILKRKVLLPESVEWGDCVVKKSTKLLGGGNENSVYFVDFEDEKKGVFKPSSGEGDAGRKNTERKTGYKRERAAYLVDLFFDFNVVPPTILKEVKGSVGSIQRYVPDARTSYEIAGFHGDTVFYKTKEKDQMKTLWVFDFLIHNSDRHTNNILCTKKDESEGFVFHAIDNGCSFSNETYRWEAESFFGEPLPDELIAKIEQFLENEKSQEVLRDLLLDLLPKKEVDAFFARVEKIGAMLRQQKRITWSDQKDAEAF